jgi:hypothetical protein
VNRLRTSALAAILVTALGSSPQVSAPHPPGLAVGYLRLPANTTDIGRPAVFGGAVAFARGVGCPHNRCPSSIERLDMANLSRWSPRDVYEEYQNVPPQIVTVGLSSRWVVWEVSTRTGWAIHALSRLGGRVITVDGSARSRKQEGGWVQMSLYGSEIAWSYGVCEARCRSSKPEMRFFIMIRTLPHGRVRVAAETSGQCDADWPSLWGNVLVWEEEGICSGQYGSNVWMRRLWSGKPRMLTTNYGGSVPVTNGRYVAYDQGKPHTNRFTEWQATMLLELRTGVVAKVGGGPAERGSWELCSPCDSEPFISDSVLGWQFDGATGLMASDLRSGQRYRVLDLGRTGPHDPKAGAAFGHAVVWQDSYLNKYGPVRDIGYARIP